VTVPPWLVAPESDRVVPLLDAQGQYAFYPGCNRNTRSQDAVTRIVCHWTGGTGGAERVVRTLAKNALSIHYVVEPSGRIVQTATHDTRCAHAGVANDGSIGIEVVSRGYPTRAGDEYDVYTIGGRRVRCLRWPPEQMHSVLWLVEALCGELGIPRVIPGEDGEVSLSRRGGPSGWVKLDGVIGHLHVHSKKDDPGGALFHELRQEGFALGDV
jgi:N-acetyl-anhydromuramyl-L-alanine amidase AmpD